MALSFDSRALALAKDRAASGICMESNTAEQSEQRTKNRGERIQMRRVVICALFAVLCSLPLIASTHYPSPQGYVTDAAGILDPSSKSQLENQLGEFERQTSIQMAVVTVPSLEGGDI